MKTKAVVTYSFKDDSGTVLFNLGSGETMVLGLTVTELEQQLQNPESDLLQNSSIRSALRSFFPDLRISS